MDPRPLAADIDRLRCMLWEGARIVVKISCVAHEVATIDEKSFSSSSEQPSNGHSPISVPSCFALMSRLSYLHQIDEAIINFLRLSCLESGQEHWFECDGVPLRPTLPIGLLYDLTRGSSFDQMGNLGKPSEPQQWNLTIHFGNSLFSIGKFQLLSQIYSAGEVDNKTIAETTGQRLFQHSLKQACFLITGHTRGYTDLNKTDRQGLLDTLSRPNPARFNELLNKDFLRNPESMKSVPLRVYLSSSWFPTLKQIIGGEGGEGAIAVKKEKDTDVALFSMIQMHVQLSSEIDRMYYGSSTTHPDSIASGVSSSSSNNFDGGEIRGGGAEADILPYLSIGAVIKDLLFGLQTKNNDLVRAIAEDKYQLCCQGVAVDRATPITLLWRLMMYCDLFLYVSIHPSA